MRVISKLELFLLVAFFFVLPMYESPKNLFLVAYIITWCMQSWRAKDFGGKLHSWEWLLALFLATGFISAYTNPFGWEKSVSGALTFSKLIIPAILLSRTTIPMPKVTLLGSSIILGTFIAVLSSWYVWIRDDGIRPELNSVGHFNHSALYIAVTFGVSLALLMIHKGWKKRLFAAIAIFFVIAVIPTNSITAAATIIAMTIAAIAIHSRPTRNNILFLVASTAFIVVALTMSIHFVPVVKNFQNKILFYMNGGDTGDSFLSRRDQIFNAAIFVLPKFPLFGAGDRNFGLATDQKYMESLAVQRGVPFEAERFYHTNHGHNLVTSILLNRGYLGLFLILGFIFIATWKHLQWLIQYYSNRKPKLEPVTGIMTGIYIIVGGMGNSTLYVEHGQLAFCLIGLSLGYLQRKSDRKVADSDNISKLSINGSLINT